MAENGDDIRALPNLARFSQSMSAAAEEAAKFQNLPAFDADNQLSRAIERLTEVMAENTRTLNSLRTEVTGIKTEITEIKTEITEIKTEINGIKTQISVTDSNSVARVQNANIQNSVDPLSPFSNPATNTMIEGFPQTAEEIRHMSGRTLNTVLEGLGLSTSGHIEEKRKRLRSHIGLRPIPRA